MASAFSGKFDIPLLSEDQIGVFSFDGQLVSSFFSGINVSDAFDFGKSSVEDKNPVVIFLSHLSSVQFVLSKKCNLLSTDLVLLVSFSYFLVSVNFLRLVLPFFNFLIEVFLPVVVFFSFFLNSDFNILATTLGSFLDSDDSLLLVAPLQFSLKSLDNGMVLVNNSLDMSGVNTPCLGVFDSSDDVLVLEALSCLVHVLVLDANSVNVLSEADLVTVVSFESGTRSFVIVIDNNWLSTVDFNVFVTSGNNNSVISRASGVSTSSDGNLTSSDSPFPSKSVLVASLVPLLALGKSSLIVASVLPNSAVLSPSTVGFDVVDGSSGEGLPVFGDVISTMDDFSSFEGLDGWLFVDDLGRSRVTNVNLSSGQLESEFLSGCGHVGYLIVHASVGLVCGKSGTA